MSLDQIEAFLAKVKDDEALAQKLKNAQAAYTGDISDKAAAVAAVIIPVAAEAGFNFTVEDFKATFEAEGEASGEELDAVAGGVISDNFYCPLDYVDPPLSPCPFSANH